MNQMPGVIFGEETSVHTIRTCQGWSLGNVVADPSRPAHGRAGGDRTIRQENSPQNPGISRNYRQILLQTTKTQN